MVSPLARVTGGQLFRWTFEACLADAGGGSSSRDSVVSGVADAACAWLEDIALEKPGTMAMTSVPSIANRLACIQWRRVQRPLKPAGNAAARPMLFRAAARRCRIRIRFPRTGTWGELGWVSKSDPRPARRARQRGTIEPRKK